MQHSDELMTWTPVPTPDRGWTLYGRFVTLVSVDPHAHLEALWSASHTPDDAALWQYLFYGPFPDREAFRSYLTYISSTQSDIFFAIVDKKTDRPSGIASYLRMEPEHGSIEIGHIWFGAQLQKTRAATEAIYLLARHVFDDLGYRRLEWKCDAENIRSRRAATRFGFSFEGIFRNHMVIKGRNRDTAWFAITAQEWPTVRAAFIAWLDDRNFDESGRQLASLSDTRAELRSKVHAKAAGETVIRAARAEDETAWRRLWQSYNDFYGAAVPDVVTAATWKRLIGADQSFGSLVAESPTGIVGFANYVLTGSTWSIKPRCLMEDLFVSQSARSAGVGGLLIRSLVNLASECGWTKVYWITRETNFRARRMYESLTPADGFIQYSIPVVARPEGR